MNGECTKQLETGLENIINRLNSQLEISRENYARLLQLKRKLYNTPEKEKVNDSSKLSEAGLVSSMSNKLELLLEVNESIYALITELENLI